MLKSKNPCGFVTETFKTGITNPQGFFDLSNFYIIKLISEPLTLRPLCCSRLRSNEKCLVDQLLLSQDLLKNVFNSKTFLNWRPLLCNFTAVWNICAHCCIPTLQRKTFVKSPYQVMKLCVWLPFQHSKEDFCQFLNGF